MNLKRVHIDRGAHAVGRNRHTQIDLHQSKGNSRHKREDQVFVVNELLFSSSMLLMDRYAFIMSILNLIESSICPLTPKCHKDLDRT